MLHVLVPAGVYAIPQHGEFSYNQCPVGQTRVCLSVGFPPYSNKEGSFRYIWSKSAIVAIARPLPRIARLMDSFARTGLSYVYLYAFVYDKGAFDPCYGRLAPYFI